LCGNRAKAPRIKAPSPRTKVPGKRTLPDKKPPNIEINISEKLKRQLHRNWN
jgi:hypothetical protein